MIPMCLVVSASYTAISSLQESYNVGPSTSILQGGHLSSGKLSNLPELTTIKQHNRGKNEFSAAESLSLVTEHL